MKIMVVDDDPRILAATAEALRATGHDVVACADGAMALAVIADGDFNLLVSDVQMPGMSGPELMRAAKATVPGLAVLFVSGDVGALTEADFGGHEVLAKPFTAAALARALGRAH
jgi:CheY-like chemotaxis protein